MFLDSTADIADIADIEICINYYIIIYIIHKQSTFSVYYFHIC